MKMKPFMRRAVIVVVLVIVAVGLALATSAQPTQALEANILKIKSDCVSVEMYVTLNWKRADNDAGEDIFRVYIYEREAFAGTAPLTTFDERLNKTQELFFWRTHRISAPTHRGRYTIEIWDINDVGDPASMIDQVHYECSTGISWRGGEVDGAGSIHTLEPPDGVSVKSPPFGCGVEMPIFTTNQAPESGAVIIMWSGVADRESPYFDDYIWRTIEVEAGDYFNGVPGGEPTPEEDWFHVPCGVYLWLYYQPDSTKILYHMPSQHWPDRPFGAYMLERELPEPYHTFFPLDGPPRTDIDAPPSPTPRPMTPTPTPDGTPTATPEA